MSPAHAIAPDRSRRTTRARDDEPTARDRARRRRSQNQRDGAAGSRESRAEFAGRRPRSDLTLVLDRESVESRCFALCLLPFALGLALSPARYAEERSTPRDDDDTARMGMACA